MSATAYRITLIAARGAQARTAIHHNPLGAIRSALATFDEPDSAFSLTCIPLKWIGADEPVEEQSCAA